MNASAIAASGLYASIARLNGSASNSANIDTVGKVAAVGGVRGDADTPAYQPVDIEQTAMPGGGVSAHARRREPASYPLYDPSSPVADAAGMVATPNVDPAQEAVEQIKAETAYKASLSVMHVADDMDQALLDLKA